jgi:hypothetical protein
MRWTRRGETMTTADAILRTLESSDLTNSGADPANVVDALDGITRNLGRVAGAITPLGVAPGHDALGGTVCSLTEAVMGMTAAMVQIASAIGDLAEAVRERGSSEG